MGHAVGSGSVAGAPYVHVLGGLLSRTEVEGRVRVPGAARAVMARVAKAMK